MRALTSSPSASHTRASPLADAAADAVVNADADADNAPSAAPPPSTVVPPAGWDGKADVNDDVADVDFDAGGREVAGVSTWGRGCGGGEGGGR